MDLRKGEVAGSGFPRAREHLPAAGEAPPA
jgi:hypothetical protein